MDNKEISLTREAINKIIGFFHTLKATRGYPVNTPIGEIAHHAHHHWVRITNCINSLNDEINRLKNSYEIMKASKECLEDENKRLMEEVRFWHLTKNDTPNETEQVLCLLEKGVDHYFVATYNKEFKEFRRYEMIDGHLVQAFAKAEDVLKWKYIK